MKPKNKTKKNINRRNFTKKYYGGLCVPESNVITITYGGILGTLNKIFDVKNLTLGQAVANTFWGIFSGRGLRLPKQVTFMLSIYTIYSIILNIVDPNYKKPVPNNPENFQRAFERITAVDIENLQKLKEALKNVIVPVDLIKTEYEVLSRPFHKKLIRDQFVVILQMFREENNDKLYADFSQEENKTKLDPFVDHFYDYSLAFMHRTMYFDIRDFGTIFGLLTNVGNYDALFIHIYSLLMHRLRFFADGDFVRYECDSDKTQGILKHKTGCDGANLMKHGHEVENSLKIVLEMLFGRDISQFIKYYPDTLRSESLNT